MPIRDTLNKNPKLAAATLIVLLLAAGGLIASSLFPARVQTSHDAMLFYTVDDGATWFADSAALIPPFDYKGKPAVRVFVFQGDQGSPFAGYLMRYSDAARKRLNADPKSNASLAGSGMEYKKPLTHSNWAAMGTREASDAQAVVDPKGQKNLVEVDP